MAQVPHSLRATLRAGAVAALFVAAGCSDPLPTYRGVSSVTAAVGPEGGRLVLASGIELKVPTDALGAEVAIELKEVMSTELGALAALQVPPGGSFEKPISLTPHGTTFMRAVKVEVPLVADDSLEVKVYRLDDPTATVWTEIPSQKVGDKVEFETTRFSFYVVVLGPSTGTDGDGGVIVQPDGGGGSGDAGVRFDAGSDDDGGVIPDGGMPIFDMSPTDASAEEDSGPIDLGSPSDAGASEDSGPIDLGSPSDAGASEDAGAA